MWEQAHSPSADWPAWVVHGGPEARRNCWAPGAQARGGLLGPGPPLPGGSGQPPGSRCPRTPGPPRRGPAAHLHLLEHWVVLNPREEHAHGVGAVVQEGDAGAVQVVGQLMDVRLQLCKGCGQTRGQGGYLAPPTPHRVLLDPPGPALPPAPPTPLRVLLGLPGPTLPPAPPTRHSGNCWACLACVPSPDAG